MRKLALIALLALVPWFAQARNDEPATTSAAAATDATPAQSASAPPATASPRPAGATTKPAGTTTPEPASVKGKQGKEKEKPAASKDGSETKTKTVSADEVPPGYRAAYRDGELVYCRFEGSIGTRFRSKVCYTPQELKDIEERRALAADELTRRARVCVTGSVCSSQ